MNQFPVIEKFLSIASKFCFLSAVYIAFRNRIVFTKLSVITILFFGIIIYSSIINRESYITIIPIFMKTLGIIYLFDYLIKVKPLLAIKYVVAIFICVITLNLLFLLIYPNLFGKGMGTSNVYLIASNYNQFGGIFIVALFYTLTFVNYLPKYRIWLYILFAETLFSTLYTGSATSSIGIICVILFWSFKNTQFVSKYSSYILFVLSIGIFFTFVFPVFQILTGNNVEQFVSTLGKDMTFSGRTTIWEYSLIYISSSLFLGYGDYDSDWALATIFGVTPHNILLHILMWGGIILLSFSIICITSLIIAIKKNNVPLLTHLSLFILCLLFLMLQFDIYNFVMLFMALLLMSRIEKI